MKKCPGLKYPRNKPKAKSTFAIVDMTSCSGMKHEDEKIPGLKYDENLPGMKHEDENISGLRYPRTNPEAKSTFAIVDTTQM